MKSQAFARLYFKNLNRLKKRFHDDECSQQAAIAEVMRTAASSGENCTEQDVRDAVETWPTLSKRQQRLTYGKVSHHYYRQIIRQLRAQLEFSVDRRLCIQCRLNGNYVMEYESLAYSDESLPAWFIAHSDLFGCSIGWNSRGNDSQRIDDCYFARELLNNRSSKLDEIVIESAKAKAISQTLHRFRKCGIELTVSDIQQSVELDEERIAFSNANLNAPRWFTQMYREDVIAELWPTGG